MAPKRKRANTSSEDSSKRSKVKSGTEPGDSNTPLAPATTTSGALFAIQYNAAGKSANREKLDAGGEKTQNGDLGVNPWPELKGPRRHELDCGYTVQPKEDWAAMRPYSNCLIQQNTYRVGEAVFVRTDKMTEVNQHDMKQFWVAKILQIRAKDPQNVYALVVWFYWPEEFPGNRTESKGRKSYHGKHEVLASNWFDVVEVLSFAGHADISYWDESTDAITSQLYWRQTFAASTTLELSKIKEHCVCHGHFNPDPDKSMFICDNEYCGVWLHKECILADALSRYKSPKTDGETTANESTSGKPTADLVENVQAFEIEITDPKVDPEAVKHTEDAKCLKCGTALLR